MTDVTPTQAALPAGIVTPLVTFVESSGFCDPKATSALIAQQLQGGVDGVLALGSTGEVGNFDAAQRSSVLRAVVAEVGGRVPVWCGVAGLGTADAIAAAVAAQDDGADALLVLQPLLFDSSPAELTTHFTAVADAVDLPVIAYDVPSRTPGKLPVPVIADLASSGVISGVKDSSGDLTAGRLLCETTKGVEGFRTYIGGEIMIDVALGLGFDGAVPGLANVLPAIAVDLHRAWTEGDTATAVRLQRRYIDLLRILDVPLAGAGAAAHAIAAIKTATANVVGLPTPRSTTPLVQPDDAFAAAVATVVTAVREG